MLKKRIVSLLCSAIFFNVSFAQDINRAKLDSLFATLSANNKAMGSIVISKDGKAIYSKSIGYSVINGQEKQLADEKTKYRIGSITKTFTSTIVLQLVEEGKLSLETKLNKFYPEIPNSDKITISNLLQHRSGLKNFTSEPSYLTWMEKPKSKAEMLQLMASLKPDNEPDIQSEYSNTNYVLLGYIIEKVTKKSYQQNLTERIIEKIGLKDTYMGGKIDTKKNESQSYSFDGSWNKASETDMSIPHGAGAIVSTPSDLTKFIEALFAGKLINSKSLKTMKTIKDGYGMGIFEFPFGDKKAFGHNGGIDGFGSMLGYFPKENLTIAYCTNGQNYPINDIMIGVLSIYFNIPYSIPSFKTVAIAPEEMDKFLGVYSSSQMPLKITFTKQNTTLMAQATGQPAFPLEPTDINKFRFDQAGVVIEFIPEKNEMLLKQGGGNFVFTKDK